jgi:glycosyltransferase involved in cell wall biosynthesis
MNLRRTFSPRCPQDRGLTAGVLCYNLCPPTVELIQRISLTGDVAVRVYALMNSEGDGESPSFTVAIKGKRRLHVRLRGTRATEVLYPGIAVVTLFRMLRECDVVLSLGFQGLVTWTLLLAGRLLRVPVGLVLQSVGPDAERARPLVVRLLKRIALRFTNLVVVQTPPTLKTLEQVYSLGADCRKISAPFSAGAAGFSSALMSIDRGRRDAFRKRLGVEDTTPVILFVGSLYPLKGPDQLLKAVAQLGFLEWRLIIAGAPHVAGYDTVLRELAVGLGIADRTVFMGRVRYEDLPVLYSSAELFVLPTRKDVWPKVLIEAALTALPIVTTEECGAAGYLVRDGINGYIVQAESVEALAARIGTLCRSGELRTKFGQQSRRIVNELCDTCAEERGFQEAIGQLRCGLGQRQSSRGERGGAA